MRTALTIAFAALGASLARADTIEERPVTTPAGQEVRLGAYAAIRSDCSGGSAATLKPTGDQRGGLVVIVPGTLTTAHAPGCAGGVTSPAQVLFYRPNPGFTGADRVTFGVVDPATGSERAHSVAVTVTP